MSKKPVKKATSKSPKTAKPAAKKPRAPRPSKKVAPVVEIKAPATAPAPVAAPPAREAIAVLARDLWDRKGRPTGRDLEIWLEAEHTLSVQSLSQ